MPIHVDYIFCLVTCILLFDVSDMDHLGLKEKIY